MRMLRAAALMVLLPALATLPAEIRAQPADQAVTQEHGAGGVRLTMAVDRREIAIDGRVRITLQLEMPADRLAALPELPDRFGPFAVVSQSPAESTSSGGAVQLRRAFELEPEGVGELILPPLVVAVRDRQGDDDAITEIRTDPVSVTVTSVVPERVDYTEPKDIAPPLSLPRPGWPTEVWLLLAVIAGAIVLGLLAWRRRRGRAPAVRPQPAHLLALAELDRLQQAALGGEERVEAFYVRLSAILRRYLGWRYGLRALMQTTDEFVAGLSGAEGALAPYRPVLGALLANFDLVKFARYRPGPGDMEEALRWVRDFVERTGDERVRVDPRAAGTP
jgi:Domain of unknown function (DUF4381)